MPDGHHLLYSEWDRTEQIWHTSMGLDRTMWLIDVDTGEKIMLGDYHTPIIGPDGRYLAIYGGSDFHDACDFNRWQHFIRLDGGTMVVHYELADFAGFPMSSNDAFVPKNGRWQSENEFTTEIEALCDYGTGSNDHAVANEGIYKFDLTAMTAERIGDLPEE